MPGSRLLVTGGTGFAGSALVARAAAAGRFEVHATRHRATPAGPAADAATWHPLDVRDEAATRALVEALAPAVVVHAALDVSPGALREVAVDGAAHVAGAARAAGAAHIHLSSDMVFAGESVPYDEDHAPDPVSDYGRAKADAEARVRAAHPGAVIVRLSLLYRLDPPDRSLAAWIDDARSGRAYSLFVDEIRCPGQVDDVAEALHRLAVAQADGGPAVPPIVHLAGPVPITRYAFGLGVLEALGLPDSLAVPGRASDAPVERPRELVLVARTTPPWLTAPLRSPAEVFHARPRPMPPAAR